MWILGQGLFPSRINKQHICWTIFSIRRALVFEKLAITPFEGFTNSYQIVNNVFIQKKKSLDFYYIFKTCENCGFHASLLWWQENLVLNHNRAVGGAILSDLRHLLKGFEFFPRFFTELFAKFSECNAGKNLDSQMGVSCHKSTKECIKWRFNSNYNEKPLLMPEEDGFVTHFRDKMFYRQIFSNCNATFICSYKEVRKIQHIPYVIIRTYDKAWPLWGVKMK